MCLHCCVLHHPFNNGFKCFIHVKKTQKTTETLLHYCYHLQLTIRKDPLYHCRASSSHYRIIRSFNDLVIDPFLEWTYVPKAQRLRGKHFLDMWQRRHLHILYSHVHTQGKWHLSRKFKTLIFEGFTNYASITWITQLTLYSLIQQDLMPADNSDIRALYVHLESEATGTPLLFKEIWGCRYMHSAGLEAKKLHLPPDRLGSLGFHSNTLTPFRKTARTDSARNQRKATQKLRKALGGRDFSSSWLTRITYLIYWILSSKLHFFSHAVS